MKINITDRVSMEPKVIFRLEVPNLEPPKLRQYFMTF